MPAKGLLKSNRRNKMIDLLKKNLYVGLGLLSMTQNKIVEVGKKLAEESKLSEDEGKKFVDELMKQAEESKENLQAQVSKIVEKTVMTMKLPCSTGFERMEVELKKLQEAVARLEEKISKNK